MNRPNSTYLLGFFMAVIVAMCGVSLLKGGLYVAKHEGDTYHLLEIVFRMADGQWPHLDFMTPIGVLAFAPITLFATLGFGVGMSFMLAQTLVALVCLPAVWWVARSRLNGGLAYLFGAIVLVMITALIYGDKAQSVSVSMHYNRWAWAIAFIAIALAVLPSQVGNTPKRDGIVLGLCFAVLALIKVTYFAAFIGPVVVALIMRRSFQTMGVAAICGILVAVGVSVLAGFDFWAAYLGDILQVVGSDIRSEPGLEFSQVMGAAPYLGGSLALLMGVVLLRQSGEEIGGLLLLLLVPAFFFVSYQNFGNDPQWLLLLGVLLLALQPVGDAQNGLGWNLQNAVRITAAMAFAFTLPSFVNLTYSPFRHFGTDTSNYTAMLPDSGIHTDLLTYDVRANRVDGQIAMDGVDGSLAGYAELAKRSDAGVVMGEVLPRCELSIGMVAWFNTIAKDLDASGLVDDRQVFTADIIGSQWLHGKSKPPTNGAPWYYSGLPGFDTADYLLVPLCPILQSVRNDILVAIAESGAGLTEVRRTDLYILFEVTNG